MNFRNFIAIVIVSSLFGGVVGYGAFSMSTNTVSYTARAATSQAITSQPQTSPAFVDNVGHTPQTVVPTSVPTPAPVVPKPVVKPAPAPAPAPSPKPTPVPAPAPVPKPKPAGYTMALVSQHASESSCWTVISGSVYDLTDYVYVHPGGSERILYLCGGDGTSAFQSQHMGDFRAESVLSNYRLGPLS